MSSKSVIIVGLLASLLLIFLCVFFNAERYYKELGLGTQSNGEVSSMVSSVEVKEDNPHKGIDGTPVALAEVDDNSSKVVETKEEDRVDAISPDMKEENSTFNYYHENNKTFIFGNLPLLDDGDSFKRYIANCSKDKYCENNVTFHNNEETIAWKGLAASILTLFDKEQISNPKLLIDKKEIIIEGEFAEQVGKDQLLTLLSEHNESYVVADKSTVASKVELKKDENQSESQSAKVKTKKDEAKKDENQTAEVEKNSFALEQEKIFELLKNNKINFKKNSGRILKSGKKVLDKVVAALAGKENIRIEVQGHTDAGGKDQINLQISQMRADGVKKYLVKKGLKADTITAKGFGEKKLLLPKSPKSSKNRRVEIYLKEMK
jgi:outer membrane protein OmpA-like peptidoglycan-associated protein